MQTIVPVTNRIQVDLLHMRLRRSHSGIGSWLSISACPGSMKDIMF